MRVRLAPLDVKRCLCPANGAVALTCVRHIYSPLRPAQSQSQTAKIVQVRPVGPDSKTREVGVQFPTGFPLEAE